MCSNTSGQNLETLRHTLMWQLHGGQFGSLDAANTLYHSQTETTQGLHRNKNKKWTAPETLDQVKKGTAPTNSIMGR